MMFYLICYDIADDKRRNKIASILEGYGSRVQFSVFECVLSGKQYQQLQQKLKKIFKKEEDSLRFYCISRHTLNNIEVWGVNSEITEAFSSVIV
ncbi:MAG: CRISPR-associated endonuclease Cas2 [Cyanobacterium sp. T60_A2020_053]|nr:CRISPR-associated endonuclease Cas2 [Cyanobacterium sp. T60_A2020_053]